jgi:hypothetical protein
MRKAEKESREYSEWFDKIYNKSIENNKYLKDLEEK